MMARFVKLPEKKSFFLFGPRGSGKSTLLKTIYKNSHPLYFDLLDLELLDELSLYPKRFIERIGKSKNLVIVDEIQKLPRLLDYIHLLIEEKGIQFILTGSSARRLKQKGTNLLAGRAMVRELYPFSSLELKEHFDLRKVLERGALPDSYLADSDQEAFDYLRAYTLTYLEKEIQAEQWVRKLEPFRKFLILAAQMNGKIINNSLIARDIGVDDMTIKSYFEILEDTYIGFYLPAFNRSLRKQFRHNPKFYLFDPGIKRALERTMQISLLSQTSAFGEAFEHWVILEFIKLAKNLNLDWEFYYFQTKDGAEIDLIIVRSQKPLLLIEIKSKTIVSPSDARNLENMKDAFKEDKELWLLSQDPLAQDFGNTKAMHWQNALNSLAAY